MKKIFPLVTIITVNYNGKGLLKDYFESLHSLEYPRDRLEMVMVDNCSRDGSVEYVRKNYPAVRLMLSGVNNYCRANNLAIRGSKAEFIALLNNDVRVTRSWLAQLMKVMLANPKISTAGGKILFPDGRIQSTGHVEFPYFYIGDRGTRETDSGKYNSIEKIRSVSNSSALYRRKAVCEVGCFDEDFHMYMEDADINYRMCNKGWSVVYVPQGLSYHILHGSGQSENERLFYGERNRLLFIAKHFPEKLPESLYGFGEISRFPRSDFQKIIAEVIDKVQKNYDKKKMGNLMKEFQKSVDRINDFRAHCFAIDLERKTSDIRLQLSERERKLIALQDEIARISKEIASRDAQLLVLREALEDDKRQLDGRLSELQRSRDEMARCANEIAKRDAQVISSQEALDDERQRSSSLVSDLQLSRDEIVRYSHDAADREVQLRALQEALEEGKQQLSSRLVELTICEDDRARYVKEIDALVAERKSMQVAYDENKQQLNGRLSEIAVLKEQITGQSREIKVMQEMIHSQADGLKSLQERNNEQRRIINDKQESIEIAEKEYIANQAEMSRQSKETIERQQDSISRQKDLINGLSVKLEQSNGQINDLGGRIISKDAEIGFRDQRIKALQEEVDNFRNSETYRWIVHPIIWPAIEFLKKANNLLHTYIFRLGKKTKIDAGVSIAYLSVQTTIACYARDSQYTIKLVNNAFAPKKVKLLMDFWPSQNRYHHQRHYAFFSVLLSLPAKESVEVVFIYNWDKKALFCVDGAPKDIVDFWRGDLLSAELYQVCAYLYAQKEGCELDNKAILQKLQL